MSEREIAGEGETAGVTVGASIRGLGTRDRAETEEGGFLADNCLFQF